jgi:SAM-dependent methyltransferase
LIDPTAYEHYLVPVLFRPLAQALLQVARPLRGRRVLDVACGTGVVARLAAAEGGTVVGVDVDPALLAVARDLEPGVDWLRGDAAALPLPDEAFDVAFCQQGLQFVAEPGHALRELHRVLSPGGRIALAVWCDLSRAPGFDALATILDRHGGPGDLMRRPFILGDAATVRGLLAAAGFTDVHVTTHIVAARFPSVRELFHRQVAASPLADPIAALHPAIRESVIRDLEATLGAGLDDDGILFPVASYLITAIAEPVSPPVRAAPAVAARPPS